MKLELELVEIPEADLPEFHHRPSPWFSRNRSAFLLWTTRRVWALSLSGDHRPKAVDLGQADQEEFLDSRRDGFRYFAVDIKEILSGFDPLREHAPVEHRFSKDILVCDKRTIRLWNRDGQELAKKSVTKPMTAKTAAKDHPWIFVGDNNGEVRRLTLEQDKLGRIEKIAATRPPVRSLLLADNDRVLYIGGMGELQKLAYRDGRYTLVSSRETATRELLELRDDLILLNRGSHNLQIVDEDLQTVFEMAPPFPIDHVCLADDGETVLATSQMPPYRDFALIHLDRG